MITLNNIFQTKQQEVVQLYAPTRDFVGALTAQDSSGLIAEYKRSAPSVGDINLTVSVESAVQSYQAQGAACLSILTDETYFKGDLNFIQRAKAASHLPVLRKDFIIDSIQVYQSKLAGADAILLIAALLTDQQLQVYTGLAHSLHMQVLLEVHDATELQRALLAQPDLIGMNSRNLKTMQVDTNIFKELITQVPAGTKVIAESGLTNLQEVAELKTLGFTGALMGTHLMQNLWNRFSKSVELPMKPMRWLPLKPVWLILVMCWIIVLVHVLLPQL